jgi:hypothetical protein
MMNSDGGEGRASADRQRRSLIILAAQPELRKNPTNPTVFRVIRLPEGVGRLPSSEAIARGFGDHVFVENGVQIPRLTTDLKLLPWGKSGFFYG